ncbi:MAG: DUF1657 domain-containing protein [Bacillota bacterium]|jgi:hypothetical protein
MTVAAQVKQTIASLKGVKATLDTFASYEGNETSKQLLAGNARLVDDVIKEMENRLGTLEFEEPQYKGF